MRSSNSKLVGPTGWDELRINTFVGQYYNVLHQSPQVVHLFYTDANNLTHAEAGPDGVVDTVVTQDVCIYPPTKPSLESALFLFLYMDFNFLPAFTHVFCWHTGFMQEIPNKVMSVDYSDFKAEIKTVDSQESLMGGVLMMVNGSLSISQDI